jgi:UDPglucose--hexose-1-phosphate uridylyltransferase
MSEFRQNFATKEWVIISPGRSQRPRDIGEKKHDSIIHPEFNPDCPFCPGNEGQTGEELLRYGDGNAWTLRAVRNKFSALDHTRSVQRRQHGLFMKSDSYGDAEVVVESPLHNVSPASMPREQLRLLLWAYRERSAAIAKMRNISIVMIFRNSGPGAGTSLAHPHSQIIASPIIPPHIRDPFQKAALHYDSYGRCVYCEMVEEERRQGERIVAENDHFVSFCPFASRTPFEMRIYPLRHDASYVWVTDEAIDAFTEILQDTLKRMASVLDSPSYNFIIRSAPIGDEDVRYLHWYFVLIPKISTPAGFEIGSGIYINPTSPEDCAALLRGSDRTCDAGA